jgi:hypothetical protein
MKQFRAFVIVTSFSFSGINKSFAQRTEYEELNAILNRHVV